MNDQLIHELMSGIKFEREKDRHEFREEAGGVCPKLIVASMGAADHFLKSFVDAVWKLEKHCHSLIDLPVESAFRPNYDVYRYIGLFLLNAIFEGNAAKIAGMINLGMEKGIIFPRFGHLMLAEIASAEKDWFAEYEHAKSAHATFSQCGASYRAVHRAWSHCVEDGLEVPEDFPSDSSLKGKFCSFPFEMLSIRNDGKKIIFYPCQSTLWMSYAKTYSADKFNNDDLNDFWNCAEFREIRRSIHDGDFSYCSKLRCPRLLRLPDKASITDPWLKGVISERQTIMAESPKSLILGYEETCNLACPSCRSKPFAASKELVRCYDRMADKVILPLIDSGIRDITCNCSGEALASPHTLRLLNSINYTASGLPNIHLMTNGELLAGRWDLLGKARERIKELIISFDGIRPETYSQYRRGGNLDRFMQGLEFAASLRKSGAVCSLIAVMTIYEGNMDDALPIYEFCNTAGFDTLVINKFQNWGTYSAEEFTKMDVWNREHPRNADWMEIYARLLERSGQAGTTLYSTNLVN